MLDDARKTFNNKRLFVKVNRDDFQKILNFSLFCVLVFPVGGSLLNFDDFPLV